MGAKWVVLALALAGAIPSAGQEMDYQVYSEPPRLLLNQRRLRLLKRERERESLRWQQFESLMSGRARMAEPGFALALWGTVLGQPGPCREAVDWAVKTANLQNPEELRQAALVYDWCQATAGETQSALLARKLAPTLKDRRPGMSQVRSGTFTALALADTESQAAQEYLKWAVETWWKGRTLPQLKAGDNPFASRGEVYALAEFVHVIRDNLKVDLREGAAKWFEEAAPLQMLSYYPQPWPAAENEYRIPAYIGRGDPDFREAAYSRAAELALVALDANAMPHQFLQGWLMQDRFLMRGAFGITYEFLWANPYQPGLSFSYMPDLFHGRGQLLARSGWDEDASWFGYWAGQAQAFMNGQRVALKMDARLSPVPLGPVKVFFAASGLKLETGWQPPPEEGAREVEEIAFVVGLEPATRYDIEADDEEMFEGQTDAGGILELRFKPGRKAGVRIRKAAPARPR